MQLRTRRARWLAAAAIALAGCGGGEPPVMIAPGVTALTLGTGEDAYTPVADGQKLTIVFGPQGGYHFVVSLLATGIWPGTPGVLRSPDNPVTTLRAFRASGAEYTLTDENVNVLKQAYTPVADGVVLVNRFLRIATKDPREVDGEAIELRADLVDRDGRMASARRTVIAVPPRN